MTNRYRVTLTGSDIRHIAATVRRRLLEDDTDGPEPIMTSLGYVDVWTDGTTSATGRDPVVDPDSAMTGHCPICGWVDARDEHRACAAEVVRFVGQW